MRAISVNNEQDANMIPVTMVTTSLSAVVENSFRNLEVMGSITVDQRHFLCTYSFLTSTQK